MCNEINLDDMQMRIYYMASNKVFLKHQDELMKFSARNTNVNLDSLHQEAICTFCTHG
jgi:hypothetical protein